VTISDRGTGVDGRRYAVKAAARDTGGAPGDGHLIVSLGFDLDRRLDHASLPEVHRMGMTLVAESLVEYRAKHPID
jgi:hypothetical protein